MELDSGPVGAARSRLLPESGVLFVAAPVRDTAFASLKTARLAPCC